jgi:hypothetical protein
MARPASHPTRRIPASPAAAPVPVLLPRQRRLAILCPWMPTAVLALALQMSLTAGSLFAQENGSKTGISVYGPAFPEEFHDLETAHVDYLHVWSGSNPGDLMNRFAHGASIFTRDGVTSDYSDLQEIVSLVVPQLRIRGTHIHHITVTDGWATVGEVVEFADARVHAGAPDDPPLHLGATMTIWERGPDERWRVVFFAAPWIGRRMWEVFDGMKRVGSLPPGSSQFVGGDDDIPGPGWGR